MGGVVGGGIPEPFVRIDLVINSCTDWFSYCTLLNMKNSASGPKYEVSAIPLCLKWASARLVTPRGVTTVWLAREGVIDVSE